MFVLGWNLVVEVCGLMIHVVTEIIFLVRKLFVLMVRSTLLARLLVLKIAAERAKTHYAQTLLDRHVFRLKNWAQVCLSILMTLRVEEAVALRQART